MVRTAATLLVAFSLGAIIFILRRDIAAFVRKRTWREVAAVLVIALVIGIAMLKPNEPSQQAVASQVTPQQRREAATALDKWFLRNGYEVQIQIRTDEATTIEISCPLFNRVAIQKFDDQKTLREQMARFGFKSVIFYGHQRELVAIWNP